MQADEQTGFHLPENHPRANLRLLWGEEAPGAGSALLAAVRLDVEDDQENGRDQHEQQAGHETEIVGFHQGMEDSADRITIA